MKRTIQSKECRVHSFIKVLGLIMLMLSTVVCIACAAPFAYVTNSGSNTVSVIDTATNNVTATVPVEWNPRGIAVTPDGKRVYVTCKATNDSSPIGNDIVSVIDTETNKVTSTMEVGLEPAGIAVTPDGKKLYVANCYDNSISMINTTTNNVSATMNLGVQGLILSRGIAVTPDGKKVYVANYGYDDAPGNTISIIDTATNNITDTVKVGNNPSAVAIENLMGTASNASNQSTSNETSTQNAPQAAPGGFNYLIFAMIVFYIWKKST